ncbi:hypothetical protein [Streptomyces sp. NPDC046161]|uniref:hypothetical protein n=1 Tax=Streptomyces sp. NPDC046161 TaxID=3155132 RepID=UPI00340E4AD8
MADPKEQVLELSFAYRIRVVVNHTGKLSMAAQDNSLIHSLVGHPAKTSTDTPTNPLHSRRALLTRPDSETLLEY